MCACLSVRGSMRGTVSVFVCVRACVCVWSHVWACKCVYALCIIACIHYYTDVMSLTKCKINNNISVLIVLPIQHYLVSSASSPHSAFTETPEKTANVTNTFNKIPIQGPPYMAGDEGAIG